MLHPQARSSLQAGRPDDGEGTEELALWDPRFDPADERRRDREAALSQTEQIPVEVVRDMDAGGVGVRLYRPRVGAPVALYVHGGGWVFHDLETHDAFCRYLASETGWALLSVDYRRAPENPYPAPLDDVQAAHGWLRDHAADLGVDAGRLAGIGDSSGANLVAALCVRDPQAFAMQVLLYPPVDPACDTESMRTEEHDFTAADMAWFWDAYAPTPEAKANPEVAPLRATDLSAMPPTMVLTAEHDILCDEGEAFAARLAEAGVATTAVRYLGMLHGFWRHPGEFDASRAAVRQVAGALRDLAR